jgi:microcystin degradation protein MlrC
VVLEIGDYGHACLGEPDDFVAEKAHCFPLLLVLAELGIVLISDTKVVPDDMAFLNVRREKLKILCGKSRKWIDAQFGKIFADTIDILKSDLLRADVSGLMRQKLSYEVP